MQLICSETLWCAKTVTFLWHIASSVSDVSSSPPTCRILGHAQDPCCNLGYSLYLQSSHLFLGQHQWLSLVAWQQQGQVYWCSWESPSPFWSPGLAHWITPFLGSIPYGFLQTIWRSSLFFHLHKVGFLTCFMYPQHCGYKICCS